MFFLFFRWSSPNFQFSSGPIWAKLGHLRPILSTRPSLLQYSFPHRNSLSLFGLRPSFCSPVNKPCWWFSKHVELSLVVSISPIYVVCTIRSHVWMSSVPHRTFFSFSLRIHLSGTSTRLRSSSPYVTLARSLCFDSSVRFSPPDMPKKQVVRLKITLSQFSDFASIGFIGI